MKKSLFLVGTALALVIGGVSVSSAQEGAPPHKFKKPQYRPLKVTAKPMAPASPGAAVGAALAAPAYAVGAAGGPIGVAGDVAGATIAGATTVAFAPIAALTGGPVGISPVPAPPLPIVARYSHTGKVSSSYDEGYSQDVPVDAAGPIYKLNYKEDGVRTVTPFSLAAFPITAATSAITAPLRPVAPTP